MNDYKKIAAIIVRGFALSFFTSTVIEIGIIASDVLFVRAGIFTHSEIAFKPRVILTVFYFLASMFLYSQSRTIGKTLVQGLFDESEDKTNDSDKLTSQN